ncbi:hypothetical protein CAPTEDRAFT_216954 [Capitella teleta]|uniref:Endonuclease/exonuclease/phosphatase domain-containing protein n=1 Tax=Capitella teleta TaxID=283909 RepID=R7T5B4_CAPTE|nr:hypothetical protein CAPTEDRAFT_216954 [Capitella teleta]|eukprot:ELT88166.1 hypothetical protein CAPTEDRAFT_216954 [Capitella teleta]
MLKLTGGRKEGGGFVIAPTIRASRTENDDYEIFEALSVRIESQPPLTMALIYRPPPSATNQLTRSAFLAEFEEFLSSLCSRINGDLCVLGDFNIHWDDENDSIASRFRDIVAALDMKQHVHVTTHTKKHTLDLVLTRMQSVDRTVLKDVVDIGLCDHFVIACDLALSCYDEKKKRQIMSRSLKRVDVEAFAEDFGADLADLQDDDLNDLVSSFNRRCCGRHKCSCATLTNHFKRKYERQFRKSPLEVHRQIYVDQCKEVVQLIQNTKKEYFHQKFASASAKEVFRLVDNLLHKEPNHTLPTNVPLGDLPQTFNKFFYDKVHQIRAELDASPTLPSLTTPQPLVAERGQFRNDMALRSA